MKNFRSHTPERKYTGRPKSSYSAYLTILADDFHHRCGYTDCLDTWWVDGFNIDHFVPKKPRHVTDPILKEKFVALENEYTNLIYVCPQVNRAKSDDWPTDDPTKGVSDRGEGYIDPHENFNNHFIRTDGGGILPKEGDSRALYMWQKLNLYIRLYELLWRLEQIELAWERLEGIHANKKIMTKYGSKVNAKVADLAFKYKSYRQYLGLDYRNLIRDRGL